jgi:hypothetical protein
MKSVVFLLLFLPAASFAQKKEAVKKKVMDTVIFKGVNKLLIENEMSVNQNLYLLQAGFLKRGYKVSINRKLFIISTQDSIIEGGRAAYVFNGIVKVNSIELSGKYNLKAVTSILGDDDRVFKYDIEYSGAEHALSKKLFAIMMDIAHDIQGKKTYINETRKKRGYLF